MPQGLRADWGGRSTMPMAAPDRSGRMLLAAALALCCLPYVVLGPIAAPSQVQPWAALLCWAFLVHRLLTATLRVTNFHLLVLGFALWFMLYVSEPSAVGLDYYLRRSASFVICWAILVAASYVSPALLWRALAVTLPLWTAFALLGFVSKGVYLAVTRPLVPTAIGVAGGRGATSLAPEATDFGFTMAFMVLLMLVTRKALSRDGAGVPLWPVGLALFNVLLSQSGSGFFAVIVLGGLWYLTQRMAGRGSLWPRYLVAGLMALAVLFLIGTIPETGIRGLDLIVLTLRSPMGLLDTTLSYRIVQNAVGILGMIDSHGLGYGAGAFLRLGGDIYARHDLGTFFGLTGYYATSVPLSFDGSPLAYFPVLFLEYGLVGLIFAVLLFRTVALSGVSLRPLCLAMMFMTWVQSFPAAYPPFWLLIGLALNPSFRTVLGRQGGAA